MRLLALLLLIASTASAQEGGDPEESQRLETMQVTAGRHTEGRFDVPQPVTVIGREQIQKLQPQVMTDLLRGQPGVFTQSSGPGQGIAIIRGLKGSEVLHLVDGMRLNMSFFRNSPSQYIALVDPYNIQQLEVLRGPAATLYGSDAMGGVLQVLTPEHRFSGESWGMQSGALAQYASADEGKTSRAWLASGNGSLSLSGGVTYMDFDGRHSGDGGDGEPFTEYFARGGDAKVLWSPALGHELMLSTQVFEVPTLPRYHEIAGGPGGAGTGAALPVFFKPNDRRFVHARYRWTTAFAFADSCEAHVGRQIIEDSRERLVTATTREQEHNESELTGMTLQLLSSLDATTRLTYGLDLYQDQVSSAKSRTNLTTGANSTRDPTFPDGAQEDSLGIYLAYDWRPTELWVIESGLRYSRVTTDLPATSVSPAAKVDNSDTTGHLSAGFKLTPGTRWTVNLARGFRAPNVFDLGTLGPRSGTNPQQINVPNPLLTPETIRSLDTGLKLQTGELSAELSVFVSRYDNRIEPREPTGNPCTLSPGCIEVRSENITQARYRGAEAGLRWSLPAAEIYWTLNYTRGEETRKGATRPANRVPPFNGQLGALWRYGAGLFAEPYVQFAGRQDRLDDDDQGDVRIAPEGTPGWATVNLRLGWDPAPAWRVQADLKNLGDQRYREHGSGIDAPGVGAVVSVLWERL